MYLLLLYQFTCLTANFLRRRRDEARFLPRVNFATNLRNRKTRQLTGAAETKSHPEMTRTILATHHLQAVVSDAKAKHTHSLVFRSTLQAKLLQFALSLTFPIHAQINRQAACHSHGLPAYIADTTSRATSCR
jgi:hypothetical protein